jgi:large subunit ribosomal protein L9
MAVMATEGALNDFSAKMEARAKSEAQEEAENRRVAGEIEGKEIFIEAKSGGKDRLYGAVTAADIAAALEEATGIAVDKRKIKVSSNIRQVGTYNVDIKLAKDITPVIKVTVKGKPAD